MIALLLATACVRAEPRPNVLWVTLDTVGAQHLALYGGPAATPTVASLGGRVFERAFTHFPETAVSHWAMFTGAVPEVHGDVGRYGDSTFTGPTVAEALGAAGYDTAAFIGGITLQAHACGLQRGFDTYDDRFAGETRPAAQVVAAADAWIDGRDRPWFAFVHLFDAHFPYEPANPRRYDPDYVGSFDGTDRTLRPHRDFGAPLPERDLAHVAALHHAEITELDAALAPLLGAIDDTTVVIVTADHGESFGHGYLFNHRASLYDEVLHVPLVVRAAGLAPGRDTRLVASTDLAPTVLDLVGLSAPSSMMGGTLLAPPSRVGLVARTDAALPPSWVAARSATHKAIWPLEPAGDGLGFDIVADPAEARATAPEPTLMDVRRSHEAAVGRMSRWTRPIEHARSVGGSEAERLEALGYVSPTARPAPPHPAPPHPAPPHPAPPATAGGPR